MAKKQPKKLRAKPAQATTFAPRQPRARPLVGVPLIAAAILLAVAMFDFEPAQCPVLTAAEDRPDNIAGSLGMWAAYWNYWAFGVAAWALPLGVLRAGWLLVSGQSHRARWPSWLALLGIIAGLSGGIQMATGGVSDAPAQGTEIIIGEHAPRSSQPFVQGLGGIVGKVLYSRDLDDVIGPAGVGLMLFCVFALSAFFLFRESFRIAWQRWKDAAQRRRQRLEAKAAAEEAKAKAEAEARAQAETSRKAKVPSDAIKPIMGKEGKERKAQPKPLPEGVAILGEDVVPEEALVVETPAAPEPEPEPKRKRPEPPRRKPAPPEPVRPEPAAEPAPALLDKFGPGAADKPEIVRPEVLAKADQPLPERRGDYVFPKLDLLADPPPAESAPDPSEFEGMMHKLIDTLAQFKVAVAPGEIHAGPVITRYEVIPAPGVRVEKIANLDKNIALGMKALSVRILAPVPGKGTVGIEVPNPKAQPVCLREIVESAAWQKANKEIPVVLGKDVTGRPIVEDLTRMPHMLIAGATGSGKTVCINTIIASLLYHSSPDDCRFIMVDPKVVEMQVYNDLPHMLIPVVTEPKKVPGALKYLIGEMERRYQIFAEAGVRNIAGFNSKIAKNKEEKARAAELDKEMSSVMSPEERAAAANIEVRRDPNVQMETQRDKLPYIVCIIDELADLMMVAPQDIETGIARIAQLARAAGIHLILATQRPSVNVITGVIKANLPTRIAFKVSSQVDSRTILDQKGAEALIGKGDMLYVPPGTSNTTRAQGAFVSDDEINGIVDYLKEHNDPPAFDEAVQQQIERSVEDDSDEGGSDMGEDDSGDLALKKRAIEVIKATKRASTSSIQRRLKIGYNRAARIMDELEDDGIVGPDNGSKPREILVDVDLL